MTDAFLRWLHRRTDEERRVLLVIALCSQVYLIGNAIWGGPDHPQPSAKHCQQRCEPLTIQAYDVDSGECTCAPVGGPKCEPCPMVWCL